MSERRLFCQRCLAPMKLERRTALQQGQRGMMFGSMPNLAESSLEVEIYVCTRCNKLEFYKAEK